MCTFKQSNTWLLQNCGIDRKNFTLKEKPFLTKTKDIKPVISTLTYV